MLYLTCILAVIPNSFSFLFLDIWRGKSPVIPNEYVRIKGQELNAIIAADREILAFIEEIFITDFPSVRSLPFVVFMYHFQHVCNGWWCVFVAGLALLSHFLVCMKLFGVSCNRVWPWLQWSSSLFEALLMFVITATYFGYENGENETQCVRYSCFDPLRWSACVCVCVSVWICTMYR